MDMASTIPACGRKRGILFDEIRIGIVPVLLGEGLRFFEPGGNEQMKLERTRTDIWFRVVK
jgi:dihydrofolate reductase